MEERFFSMKNVVVRIELILADCTLPQRNNTYPRRCAIDGGIVQGRHHRTSYFVTFLHQVIVFCEGCLHHHTFRGRARRYLENRQDILGPYFDDVSIQVPAIIRPGLYNNTKVDLSGT
jgi:hypothetical protein